ncbi:MAG: integration host factor subunit beta [Phycisphaerae bacterium]|nr:integration host factor subunit beta [Phycisphaerae bacterium]MBN8597399.1 integration host factor subunit beta [Planctomycetota bacterium]
MRTITKKNLIDHISSRAKIKRPLVKSVVQEFLDQVITELQRGNRLEFRDFGVFEVKNRAARSAQNPKTLEPVAVPAKRTVKFKIGRLMRESLEEPASRAKPAPATASAPTSGTVVVAKPRFSGTKVEA